MLQLVENGMPTKYLDEEGLSHVVDLAKKKFADKKELWNWQKTEKAGAVAFTPVPDSVLEPVVEFKFKETLPAEGEKGPENPSTIEGVDSISVTRCGKNLLLAANTNYSGYTIARNSDGSLSINGSGAAMFAITDGEAGAISGTKSSVVLDTAKQYTISAELISGTMTVGNYPPYISFVSLEKEITMSLSSSGKASKTFSCDSMNGHFVCRIIVPNDGGFTNAVVKIQLEEGNTATEFEAPMLPTDVNHLVSLGDTYYSGFLDVATGVMTVTHVADTITRATINTEVFTNTIKMTGIVTKPHLGGLGNVYWACDKFLCDGTNNDIEHIRPSGSVDGAVTVLIFINKSRLDISGAANPSSPTVVEWQDAGNTWLASNPVTLVYALHTQFTVRLTPTQIRSLPTLDKYNPRINTVCVDADSIQVGYQKFAAEESFVHTAGNETIDGEKTFNGFITRDGQESDYVSGMILRNKAFVKGEIPQKTLYHLISFCDNENPEYSQSNQTACHGRAACLQTVISAANRAVSLQNIVYKNSSAIEDNYGQNVSTIVGYDADGIPYATAPSTSIERNDGTDIVTRDYLSIAKETLHFNDFLSYQKTEQAKSVSFNPVPNTLLEPVVDFKFKETFPTEGSKGIDNPSTIAGVDSVKVTHCGKNLCTLPYHTPTCERFGIQWTINEDGSVSAVGTATNDSNFYFMGHDTANFYPVAGKTYYLSGCPKNGSYETFYMACTNGTDATYTNAYDYGSGASITPKTSNENIIVRATIKTGTKVDITFYPQFEEGYFQTEWESPVARDRRTISLNSIYYGGSVDLSTGIMTVSWVGKVFDGTESFRIAGENDAKTRFVYNLTDYNFPNAVGGESNAACSHASFVDSTVGVWGNFRVAPSSTGNASHFYMHDKNEVIGTVENFTSWVAGQYSAGTPLTVVYKIATPYTVQLTSEQIYSLASLDKYSPRFNTIYTDADSVKVGYQWFVDDSNVVHKTSNETIDGVKTFKNSISGPQTGTTITSLFVRNSEVTRGVPLADGTSYSQIVFLDNEGVSEGSQNGRLGVIEVESPKIGKQEKIGMYCYKYSSNSTDAWNVSGLIAGYDEDGTPYASAPEISSVRTASTDIVTRGWRISDSEIDELSL